MKATLVGFASLVVMGLIGCSDTPSSPTQAMDQTISPSLTKGGGNILLSDGGSQGRGRRDSLRVKGLITAVDTIAGTVTLGTTVVQTDSSTTIERNGRHVRLSALQVGDRGEARLRAGSTVASKVEAEASGIGLGEEEHEIKGLVTAVDTIAGTLTIGTTVVQTNSQTRILRNHSNVPLSAIQIGDRCEAHFPAGSTIASKVEAEAPHGGHGGEEQRIEGTVTAVDTSAATLTIGTTVVPTNAQTRIERNHQQVTLSAIQVGDRGEARIPVGATVASRVEAESH